MMSRLSVVIFDFDGTLTRPCLDFDAIRAEIGGIKGPILEALEQMDETCRRRAEAILLRHESEAATKAELYDGAVDVLRTIRDAGRPVAILTRNSQPSVHRVMERFGIVIDTLRTREDGAIKPSPKPVLSICEELDCDPTASWMVGDYLFDILSGKAAGTRTVLMIGEAKPPDFANQADHIIRELKELLEIIE